MNKKDTGTDYFSYQAEKFPPKQNYRDSKMKVWTKPEPVKDIEVEETDASPSMVLRILKKFTG